MESRVGKHLARGKPRKKKKSYVREETKQGFLQGVLTLMFSQILIKVTKII